MDNHLQKKRIGEALKDFVAVAENSAPQVRIGLMMAGSLNQSELLEAVQTAVMSDRGLTVVGIGPEPDNFTELKKQKWASRLEWIECSGDENDIAEKMEQALAEGVHSPKKGIMGAVAMHYPFPIGVTTIGRVRSPARGKSMLIASCTGTSALQRAEAMFRNTVYAIATAKSLGIEQPTVGILNIEYAPLVERMLLKLQENGYPIHFGTSVRSDGGILLRGNDLIAGSVDICVTDSLTGNIIVKMMSAFQSGGLYETTGWGYGASAGENWQYIVSIVSRASGIPVVVNALINTAQLVRADLAGKVQKEIQAAKSAEFDEILKTFLLEHTDKGSQEEISAPPCKPCDSTIGGIDVLDLENAVHALWKEKIYAESAMGCTGPVIKFASANKDAVLTILKEKQFL